MSRYKDIKINVEPLADVTTSEQFDTTSAVPAESVSVTSGDSAEAESYAE